MIPRSFRSVLPHALLAALLLFAFLPSSGSAQNIDEEQILYPVGISLIFNDTEILDEIPFEEFLLTDGYETRVYDMVFVPQDRDERYVSSRVVTSTPNVLNSWSDQVEENIFATEQTLYNVTLINEFGALPGSLTWYYEIVTDRRTYNITGSYRVVGIAFFTRINGVISVKSGENNTFDLGSWADVLDTLLYNLFVDYLPFSSPVRESELTPTIRQSAPDFAQVTFDFLESTGPFQDEILYNESICAPDGADLNPEGLWANNNTACGVGFNEPGEIVFARLEPLRAGTGAFQVLVSFPGFGPEGATYTLPWNFRISVGGLPPVIFSNSEPVLLDPYGMEYIPAIGFNLFDPPQFGQVGPESISTFSMLYLGQTAPYELVLGIPDTPDHLIFFNSAPMGSLGESFVNYTVGFSIRYTGGTQLVPTTSPAPYEIVFADNTLARTFATVDIPDDIFNAENQTVVTFTLRLVPYTPNTFSQHKSLQIMSSINNSIGENGLNELNLQNVVSGSAIAQYYMRVNSDELSAANQSIVRSMESGQFAESINMRPNNVEPYSNGLEIAPAPAQPREASSGFPGWAVALIATIAAIIIFFLIILFLILVARADYEESDESEVDSDTMPGVPKPGDLNREQLIVKDFLGRGEVDKLDGELQNGVYVEVPK